MRNFVGTYCELSPTGKIHALAYGKPRHSGRKAAAAVEVYDSGRYFTATGDHIAGSNAEVTNQQAALDWLHKEIFEKPNDRPVKPERRCDYDRRQSDQELLDVARNADRNGAKFASLFDGGNWKAYYPSPSEAELWLCARLAFYFNKDVDAIDRMFRQSALMREKWNRADYRNRTIGDAIAGTSETYNGSRKARPNGNGGTHPFDPGTGEVYKATSTPESAGDYIPDAYAPLDILGE